MPEYFKRLPGKGFIVSDITSEQTLRIWFCFLLQLWEADGWQCQETQRMLRSRALRDDRRK